jgi:hypothetical protein
VTCAEFPAPTGTPSLRRKGFQRAGRGVRRRTMTDTRSSGVGAVGRSVPSAGSTIDHEQPSSAARAEWRSQTSASSSISFACRSTRTGPEGTATTSCSPDTAMATDAAIAVTPGEASIAMWGYVWSLGSNATAVSFVTASAGPLHLAPTRRSLSTGTLSASRRRPWHQDEHAQSRRPTAANGVGGTTIGGTTRFEPATPDPQRRPVPLRRPL